MWRFFGIILVIALACGVGYLGHAVQTEAFDVTLLADSKLTATYPDLIAIILTAFAVIIAVASIGLASAAVVGWNSIEGKAMKIAENVVRENIATDGSKFHKILQDAIADPESPLHKTLKSSSVQMMFEGAMNIYDSNEQPQTDEE